MDFQDELEHYELGRLTSLLLGPRTHRGLDFVPSTLYSSLKYIFKCMQLVIDFLLNLNRKFEIEI